MIKVSVIIPNYNHAAFLRERIDSVLGQTYRDFDVIILDDCSTDSSRSIIEEYRSHPNVSHIVYNEKNSGTTFKQWRRGFDLADGDWIWIAESDDVADLRFLKVLMDKVGKNPDVVLAFCGSLNIDENSQVSGEESWGKGISKRDWDQDFVSTGEEELRNQFFFKNIIPNASAAVFRKSSVNPSIFDHIEKMRFAGDWFFWVRLLERGSLAYSGLRLNKYRTHSGTTRQIKSADLEWQRFSEFWFVIQYLRRKFRFPWNLKNHRWLLNEWAERYRIVTGSDVRFFYPGFPLVYNIRLLLKVAKRLLQGRVLSAKSLSDS